MADEESGRHADGYSDEGNLGKRRKLEIKLKQENLSGSFAY